MLAETHEPSDKIILVLEPGTEISSALTAELRESGWNDQRPAAGASVSGRPEGVRVESVQNSQTVLLQLHQRAVVGLILDLNHFGRESLALLRQLQHCHPRPETIAAGSDRHCELIAVLLEAGCTALLTELPFDIRLACWVRRLFRTL